MIVNQDEEKTYANMRTFRSHGQRLSTFAQTGDDGRLDVKFIVDPKLPDIVEGHKKDLHLEEFGVDQDKWRDVPKLAIVIMIVGSRGDVQPYIALGCRLVSDGHRVRLATHAKFEDFVTKNGLEFFDIGGSPEELMSYMVKNPGLMPSMQSLTNGDITKKRKMLTKMMQGCWKACYEPCSRTKKSFAADVIISNPPTFAHIHIAEALGIPLHMSFPMPWSPTTAFHHPLVNISNSDAKPGLTNALSYAVAEQVMWQGVGDLVNSFRKNSLGLSHLGPRSGPGILERLHIPWTYCMSPALVPKPDDWLENIDISGFYFLDLAKDYSPPNDLQNFLDAGDPPIYIGFGSVVVPDPQALTTTIFEASRQANVRVLLSAGWGGLGGIQVPDHVFLIEDVPHDWLFDMERVQAVVHHGGAGTTAIGLSRGRPTAIVPFFGDQAFWGEMVWRAGAGPKPIPPKELSTKTLADALRFITSPQAKRTAASMAESLRTERGVEAGVESFYQHLPLLNMRCDLDSSRLAVWWSTKHCLKLSAFAVQVLVENKMLDIKGLELHRAKEYETRREITDPITGGMNAVFWLLTQTTTGMAQLFYSPLKGVVKTTIVVPFGLFSVFFNVSEGMHNLPRLYGSNTRPSTRPKDWKSGFKEGGKSMYFGFHDSIKGLYQLPVEGARKNGVMGAITGSAISLLDLAIKPTAGAMNMVFQPMEGSWRSIRSLAAKKVTEGQYLTRVEQGVAAVKESTLEQRAQIVDKFMRSKWTIKERREQYRKRAVEALEQKAALDKVSATPRSSNTVSLEAATSKSPVQDDTFSVRTLPPYPGLKGPN